jgi:hypothetical protein
MLDKWCSGDQLLLWASAVQVEERKLKMARNGA